MVYNPFRSFIQKELVMLLTERYEDKISGQLSCYDRIVIQGTLPGFCYAEGMTTYLYANNIRIFDYPRFAEPLRNELRDNAEQIAKANGLEIEFIRKNDFRKEQRIKSILKERGSHPGLVHIFSAMEPCPTYKPWHNKKTHRTYLKPDQSKCLHYYFYFIDEKLGLCYVRVPTWCPFRLQIYFNGHHWLATELDKRNIGYELIDNLFVAIDDFAKAQKIANRLKVEMIHSRLDLFAKRYCPVIKKFGLQYHWSIMQAEYATDIVFKRRADLQAIYGNLTRTAIHSVKPDNVATFLGRKLHGNYQDEIGNHFNTRIEGTRIKHYMGPVSIKMYDKLGRSLRIETTTNNVSFFKHYRTVEHRNGKRSQKMASMKKGIYSLSSLAKLLCAANYRYLEFISDIDDPSLGIKILNKISKTVIENNRPYKGFNLFDDDDQKLFETIVSGEFTISGFQNKNLRRKLGNKSCAQVSRILKRLRTHGLIKKIGHTYKYYLTKLGRKVILTGLKLKELFLIPELATN
jgi:hypothetical protein